MTEHIPTPLATRRLVAKHEELRRKREGLGPHNDGEPNLAGGRGAARAPGIA